MYELRTLASLSSQARALLGGVAGNGIAHHRYSDVVKTTRTQGTDVSAAFVAMMFGDENDGRGVCLWLDELALT